MAMEVMKERGSDAGVGFLGVVAGCCCYIVFFFCFKGEMDAIEVMADGC